MKKNNLIISGILIAIQMGYISFSNAKSVSATSFFALTNGYSTLACSDAYAQAWTKAKEICGDENMKMISHGGDCSDDILTLALSATATVHFSCVEYGTNP